MQDIASDSLEAIAIVGSSCRLPGGSHSPSKLWDLLKSPIDLAAEIQNNRFNAAGFYHPKAEHAGTSNVTKAYLLEDDPWTFDNDFFKISAREAESMDPQQRITLEIVYEAIECAGYSLSQLKGSSTGVFVGQMSDDYRDIILRDLDCHPQYTGTGIARSILANRVSYVFDWKGPSISIDTACSSSLVALHLAVQSLRSGECNMAVVIGVNSILSPEVFSFLSSLRMISPNGRSRMWDIHADGYARGEGYAAVVIKTLERAIDDYDDVESIIRNTGVNQDGRSTGLTVPNAASQAELIKSTYEKCGLNCKIEEDRCQYFEAHGTGTPAGDPKEAEAIDATFFRTLHQEALNSLLRTERLKNEKILVGSIKTVIGHLEGAAGLASVLKVSLAIQNGMIPPNLHFNQLNPAIEPYYGGLAVPRSLQQWPKLPTGVPRRASVNSFGFGGTNAHAIVESWDNESSSTKASSKSFCWGPFVVSANSHTALEATIVSLCEALKSKNDIELHRLAWTLQLRRSHLTYRASFAAVDKEELVTSLESAIKEKKQYPIGTKVVKASEAHILGVFTGQGAQWVSMGTELFLHSASFRRTIESLELALEEIANGPTWSLTKELMNQNNPERSLSAEISQPLCTAIQIALVDLLKASGITFSAVIGHSSGEIAAAYSADVLTATDAIVIAYYRGYHTHQSKVSGSNSGKMMAVGMAPEDAADFCLRKYFLGRINVAAINSPSSVTLAGDSNAIDEAKEILDEKAIFARILKVDTAYHSHHMECVREPYIESLQKANILPKRNTFKGSCNWYSSVYKRSDHRSMSSTVSFEHTYWADNMTKPVLFSSAIISAISKEHFNLVLEIGPHPALKGPTTECIKVASDNELPYYGVLEREKNSVKTFSNALGFVWRNIDSSTLSVDFKAFQKSCNGPNWKIPRVHKGFSPYPWDHDKPMLKESKKSKAWRTRSTPFHELLGYPSSNGDTREVRWRNILKLADLEWLQGHQFQDQVLFPAAAYLIMAVKAALHLFGHGKQPFQLVELQDFVIHNAITLEGGSSGTETNLVIKVVEESPTGGLAEFYCRSNNADTGLPDFDKEIFTGRVFVKFGAPTEDALPRRLIPSLPMTDVDTDRFYSWMSKIGLQYTKPFLLNSIKRRHNLATVTTVSNFDCGYPIHSATFDSVLQGLFAAFSYPGDGRLWTTYLPKSFRRVRFDICKCQETNYAENLRLVADCFVTRSSARNICGDVDVFRQYDDQAIIQVQGVVFDSLDIPSPANDQCMYWKTIWKREAFSQVESTKQDSTQTKIMDDYNLNEICERTSYFYLNQLYKEIGQEQVALLEGHLKEFMEFILKQVRPEKRSAPNSCWNTQWEFDTLESVKKLGEQDFASQPDLKLIHRVGSRLPSILRQSESISQVLKEDSMLETLYSQGLGVAETDHHLGALLDHLVHQFPCMRILEVGAGTGSSTSVALRHLKSGPEEYTFTNLSPSYFKAAQARFPEHKQFMRFKTLDIDQSPVEQGFQANSYDVIIAAHVLKATKSVSESLKHCRQLLRPGGYLILLEPVNQTRLRIPFLLSTSSLRWLNCEDSQSKGPPITEAQWNLLLLDNNFSGVDHALRDFEADSMHTCSVMISQAVDDQIKVLRDPLNRAGGVILMKKLLVIGGHSLAVSKVRANIKYLLGPFVEHIEMLDNLEDVQGNGENLGSAVVCLSGLEEATFATMNQQGVSAMQSLFREAKYIIWATRGCRADDPYANIAVGICRSVLREMPHLRLKLVDIDKIHLQKNRQDAIMLSEMLLQMIYLDMPSYNNILWGNETEVAVEDGAVLIPRVVRDDISNDRFNALRRNITRITSHLANPLEISMGEEGVTIKEIESNLEDPPLITTSIQVMSSSLFSIFCSDDEQPFYLSMGTSANMEEMVVAISDKNISKIKNPEYTFSCKSSSNPDEMLLAILTVIVYESLFSSTNGTIWFHNVDDRTAEIIATIAGGKEASVFLTTSNSASKLVSAGKATYIHPRVTERELILLIPCNLKRFVDMGSSSDELVELIGYTLGGKLDFHRNFRQLSLDQHISLLFSKSSLVKLLADYCSQPKLLCDVGLLAENNSIKVGLLHEQKGAASATSIISWTGVDSVHVQVAPAAHSCLFTDQKTYFLIGLAGEVGLSLCEWMINCGAKYLAIASRNPKVPPEVRRVFEKQGVVVRIFSMDVADMESLKKVYHEIVSSMPPIAGVANGALVVRDHPFDAMSFEDLETVFKPKVVGTQNLDKLFFSTPLDFFILFSSIATVVGKPGQSSYVAANLFMSALAGQRRKRGLAASVMHFGMLLGFGFIHGQTGSLLEARFRQEDCWAIPEPDFHAIFAQAIVSGRPENNLDPDIIAGLGTEIDTPWRAISRFSHCRVIGDTSIANRYHDNGRPTQSIQDRLKRSRNGKEAYAVLRAAIASRVSLALSCPIESVGEHVGLISLGIDSLLAVEIRSWIFKILEVDLPVLKLLGGSSVSDICHSVLEKLPASLKAWVEDNNPPRDEPSHGITDDSTGSSQDSQLELTTSVRDSFGEPNQEGLLGNISTEELELPSHTFLGNTQADKERHQLSQAGYERMGDMSESQAQLYFLHEYLQSNAYNVAYFGQFHGRLDVQKLSWALRLVSKRHEALRSAYFIDISTGRPVQAVLPEPNFTLIHEATHGDEQFQTEIERVKEMKFDIENGVVMKVTVVSHSSSLHSIIFNHHHIALDGFSWNIFIAELAQMYSAGPNSIPKSINVQQPIDMVKRQLSELSMNNEKHQVDTAFWRKTYRSMPPQLPLFPFAKVKSRPSIKEYDYRINSSDFKLSHEMTKLIEKVALKIGVTPFHFYFASFATFLGRCLGVSDIAIGVVNANRTDAEDMETIGHFLNMLPVYISLGASEKFEMIAKRSRDAVATVFSHPHTPNDTIDQQSLFQVVINYRKSSVSKTGFGNDGEIEWKGGVPAGNPYDLLLNVAAMPDWTYISLITQQSLYTAADGALLLKWYTRALEAVARDPSVEISKCPISNEADTAEAIELGRGSKIEGLWQGTLLDRIDKIAVKFSSDLAIIDEQAQNLTYAQMSARSIQIMRRLQAITPSLKFGSRVAMLLDPVTDAVCCILAIMRLGYVWIPLDTRNHYQRLHAVVDESRPQVLVCHDGTKELAHQISTDLEFLTLISIDDTDDVHNPNENNISVLEDIANDKINHKDQAAMILYTSGSTGVPKGVVLTNGGLLNQINGTTSTLRLQREITLQQSPLGFDLMLDQIFLALCTGGTIVIVNKPSRGDPMQIADLIVRHGVTLTHFVPSEYMLLLNYGYHILKNADSWRYAMSGGEKLSPVLRRAFYKLNCSGLQLVNVYGPAEITLACARGIVPYCEFNGLQDSQDYLQPSPNYNIEITDTDMSVLPVGFPGEICISGQGVGLGYLERPEETSRKFTHKESIMSQSSSPSKIRVYRSGDKGRILPDGTLEVFGRLDGDSQVKIHGFRVELDEIANSIIHTSNGTIVSAAVSWRQSSGILVAFVVFDISFDENKSEFIEWLQSCLPLPQVMKPTVMVPIKLIPITSNGKTDRAAVDKISVPDPSNLNMTKNPTRALNRWENSIKQIWEEVLSSRMAHDFERTQLRIDHNSDFFQVGGSSILMIKLKYLLEMQLGVKISMPELFHTSSLRSMANLVTVAKAAVNETASPTMPTFLGPKNITQVINWDLEIATIVEKLPRPRDIPSLSIKSSLSGSEELVVVLTGATGFIGKHLLSCLVQSPKVGQVHCVAIRPDASGKPRHVAVNSDKIVEYTGDLTEFNLGLSAAQFTFLAEHSHIIIHNGADVSLLKTYQSLRRANVISTRTLCSMAILRRLPVHYVSTASVAKVIQQKPLLEVPASPADADLLNSVDGYAASKWASEALLAKVAVESGIPVYIHRLAHVMGGDASELDAVGMMTKYSFLLHALPRIKEEAIEGQWDFVVVDSVVDELVRSAMKSAIDCGYPSTPQSKREEKRPAVFINHCSDVTIPHCELKEYLETTFGEPLGLMELKEWLQLAREKGIHPLIHEFFLAFDEGRGKMTLPMMSKGS